MAPNDPPTEITIRVKVPPGHIAGSSADEFTLGVLPTSSHIGDLRQQIQQLLPSNPSPERQRLLYFGRALVDNEQTIASALNTSRDTSQTEYVIHLLVKGEQDANGGQTAPSRRVHSALGGGPGLLSAGLPQEQGNIPRAANQPEGAVPQGLPTLPQGQHHPPYNLQHAQHLALLQQRQAQQMHMQQQLGRQRIPPFGVPPMHTGRPLAGPPGASPLAPGQPSPQQGARSEDDVGSDQRSAEHSNDHNATGQDRASDPDSAQTQAGETGQAPRGPQVPHRPVSGQGFHVQGVGPDGNRFEIHQQTLNIPFPGQPGPFGAPMPPMPSMGLPFPLPGMAQQRPTNQPQQPNAPSALDRARQNVTEMRQMVDDMRNANATEEDRTRIARLQQHIQAVNDYIDPFGVGRPNPRSRSSSPFPQRMAQSMRSSPALGLNPFIPPPRTPSNPLIPSLVPGVRQQPLSNRDVTCYLLSSPQGPQALLFSPQHGSYAGSFPGTATTGTSMPGNAPTGFRRTVHVIDPHGQPTPTPTQTAGAAHGQHGQQGAAPAADPAVAVAHQVAQQLNQAQQAQARPPPQDNALGPLQPLLAHFWLLFRVVIFAYFILGTNMGWRRPLALALIGLGFWMIRAGLFGEGGVARRWWDGIVRVEQRPRQQQRAQGEGAAAEGGQPGEQRPGQLPTPEELAQRLMHEREEALQRAPLHRIREHLRPVERAAALFVASFWPGVGEAHVRAREAEERRRAEEEVEQRRREEEERQRAIEAEKEGEKKEGEGSGDAGVAGDEKPAVEAVQADASAHDRKEPINGEGAERLPVPTGSTEQ